MNGVRASSSTIPQTLLKPKRQTGTPTMDESHSPNISVLIKFDYLDPLILALKSPIWSVYYQPLELGLMVDNPLKYRKL